MDRIKINELEVFSNHGVYPEEKALGQKFIVSVEMVTDARRAGVTDELEHSIHYGKVCNDIYRFMKDNTYKLIEAAAENLAAYLLRKTAHLEEITVEIKKPWAPIGLSLSYVSVEITRRWHEAYIGIGSNMGDREAYINDAIGALRADENMRLVQVADTIETKAYGLEEQGDFLNSVARARTLLPPGELLELLQSVENAAGRERTQRFGPRTLDLDILLYDDAVINTDKLTVPHYDMANREFVLQPLAQIASTLRHPILNRTIQDMYDDLKK